MTSDNHAARAVGGDNLMGHDLTRSATAQAGAYKAQQALQRFDAWLARERPTQQDMVDCLEGFYADARREGASAAYCEGWERVLGAARATYEASVAKAARLRETARQARERGEREAADLRAELEAKVEQLRTATENRIKSTLARADTEAERNEGYAERYDYPQLADKRFK